MKALRKLQPSSGLEIVDIEEPTTGSGDVKVRVLRAGICGTDLHILKWDASAMAMCDNVPFTPGHEFYGEVTEIGQDVVDVQVGDRVSVEGHVVCEVCRNCRAGRRHMCIRTRSIGVQRDGAFAEYVVVPQQNVWVHHRDGGTQIISEELGAIFDPLGNAVHTTLKFPIVGEDVLITGAGPIGLMCAAVARHAGARYIAITDVLDHRLEMAKSMGVNAVINVAKSSIRQAQQNLGMREGFDVGLEISGQASALQDMIDNMNHGGKISLLGLPAKQFEINWTTVVTHMITLQGIYGREMYETWNAMNAMLRTSKQLREQVLTTVTDVIPAENWATAFELASSGSAGKILLDWENI